MASFTFDELLREARRELAYRERVYARRVAERKLTQASADHHMALMRAIADHLKPLADAEEAEQMRQNPELPLA